MPVTTRRQSRRATADESASESESTTTTPSKVASTKSKTPKKQSKSNQTISKKKSKDPKQAPFLYRLIEFVSSLIRGFVLVLLSCFLINWAFMIYEGNQLKNQLKSVTSWVKIDDIEVNYFCTFTNEKTTKTVWMIDGTAGSMYFNHVPLWGLENEIEGIRVCKYARVGHLFTNGGKVNETNVEAPRELFIELVKKTTPKEHSLIVIGSSYGGLLAVDFVSKGLSDIYNVEKVILLDNTPITSTENAFQYEKFVNASKTGLAVMEVLSLLGGTRMMTLLPTEPLHIDAHYMPSPVWIKARHHVMSSASTWKLMAAEMNKNFLLSKTLLNRSLETSEPLLGDIDTYQVLADRFMHHLSDEQNEMALNAKKFDLSSKVLSTKFKSISLKGDHLFAENKEENLRLRNELIKIISN